MDLETMNVTLRKLTPDNPDNWLTNGKIFSKEVYLGKGDTENNWREVAQDEMSKITEEENNG